MAVRIGVPLPTSADLIYNEQCAPDYNRAVERAGGEAVPLPMHRSMADTLLSARECHGFLLPGSPADVDPALYGQERDPATANADPARAFCDRLLLEHAAASGKPVLAICYGLQHMNALQGGTLVQDLLPIPVNHAAGASVAVAHTVLVASQSLLSSLLTQTEAPAEGSFRKLGINSSHHQAVSLAGEGLTVVARCGQDGVVEALEGRIGAATVLGVQWHPERSVETSAASRALFSWLVLEAEDSQLPGRGTGFDGSPH